MLLFATHFTQRFPPATRNRHTLKQCIKVIVRPSQNRQTEVTTLAEFVMTRYASNATPDGQ